MQREDHPSAEVDQHAAPAAANTPGYRGSSGAVGVALAALLVAALLVSAASSSQVDPRALVLQSSDVPAGFRLDSRASHYSSNAAVSRGKPALQKLVAGSGRITGFAATYNARVGTSLHTIQSVTHLCRRAAGARILFAALNDQQRAWNVERLKRGGHAYRRGSLTVGDEASAWWSTVGAHFAVVMWRSGPGVATVSSWGIGRAATVELAQAQQRRIKRALA